MTITYPVLSGLDHERDRALAVALTPRANEKLPFWQFVGALWCVRTVEILDARSKSGFERVPTRTLKFVEYRPRPTAIERPNGPEKGTAAITLPIATDVGFTADPAENPAYVDEFRRAISDGDSPQEANRRALIVAQAAKKHACTGCGLVVQWAGWPCLCG